jgi:hypothetical protein
MEDELLPIDSEGEATSVSALGGEVVVTATDGEESAMVIGALIDGGRALIGLFAERYFRFRSNGKMMAWRCAKCGEFGRVAARNGLGVVQEHRHLPPTREAL